MTNNKHNERVEEVIKYILTTTNSYGYFNPDGIDSLRNDLREKLTTLISQVEEGTLRKDKKELIEYLSSMACASSAQVEHGYRLAVKGAIERVKHYYKERLQTLKHSKK
jgi:DMSO/TMAO reductase YedYZ molybdopterin-dependent catalytic subunit